MTTPEERSRILDYGTDEFDDAVKRAVRQALEEHHRAGVPIEIWRDGRIVTISADEIPALLAAQEHQPEEPSRPAATRAS